jgi:1-acyl-sn-glycerol-3-phosphate acyltransferase
MKKRLTGPKDILFVQIIPPTLILQPLYFLQSVIMCFLVRKNFLINRESKMSAFRAFKKAEESLKDGKHVVIFPEGMISENYPPVLQPFKNGPFKLAIEQGVHILPVTICNNWNLMWDDGKRYGTSPGICDICVHAPIDTSSLTSVDAEDLKNKVYGVISGQLNAHQNKQ